MVKRPKSNSTTEISPKRQKIADDSLASLKSFFRDLIAQRLRDPALAKREELWSEVVEKFSQLVRVLASSCDRSEDLVDFQLVGSALELSTEFYAAELDALSNDVYRLAAVLLRTEKKSNRGKIVETPSLAQHIMPIVPAKKSAPQQPRRHIIKTIQTVVAPELLNQKLQTNPLSSPIFQKLNTSVGDMCKAHMMIRNFLPPSHLRLHADKPFWSTADDFGAIHRRSTATVKVVALPAKMFENFNCLRIRREIDYNTTAMLSNRRVAVTLDEEDLHNAAATDDEDDSLIGADSIKPTDVDNDDEAMEDEGVEVTELDVDEENLNSILKFVDGEDPKKEQHDGDINEIADLNDVDEDEEAKINPNYPPSAHENLQLLSSSAIDLVDAKKKSLPYWKETKEKKQIRITLRDILESIEGCADEITTATTAASQQIDDVNIDQQPEPEWKSRVSLMLKPKRRLSMFDTFAYSSCELNDSVRAGRVLIDSGIVADEGATFHDDAVDFDQQSGQYCADNAADDNNNDYTVTWQPSNFLFTSTPLQPKIAARKSMKTIENETLMQIKRVDGKPVRFSRLYADVSRSLGGETSCALTFFSVLRAASSGGEDDKGKVEISRDDETEMDDFWIRSLHDKSNGSNGSDGKKKSKRKALFSSQEGNHDVEEQECDVGSFKKQKLSL